MLINLNKLNIKSEIIINEKVMYDDNIDKRIKGLENAFVRGRIYINSANEIIVDCNFSGEMLIIDSISLNIVPYKFNVIIDESLDEIKELYLNSYDNSKNILDLKQVLWQNIVLEVPISYTLTSDAEIKGNGWELSNGNNNTDSIDPRLKKLEELLERRD